MLLGVIPHPVQLEGYPSTQGGHSPLQQGHLQLLAPPQLLAVPATSQSQNLFLTRDVCLTVSAQAGYVVIGWMSTYVMRGRRTLLLRTQKTQP